MYLPTVTAIVPFSKELPVELVDVHTYVPQYPESTALRKTFLIFKNTASIKVWLEMLADRAIVDQFTFTAASLSVEHPMVTF